MDKFNNSLAEVKRGIIEEHRKASKFQRFMHYYTRYHNHEMSHRVSKLVNSRWAFLVVVGAGGACVGEGV